MCVCVCVCVFVSYVPESATRSLAERPFDLKLERRALRLEVGRGMLLLAAAWLAVLASLRPNFTSHDGPPSCQKFLTVNVR